MSTSDRHTSQIAGWVFVALVAFSWLLQVEAYVAYAHRGTWLSALAFVVASPFLLLEHVAFAAALSGLAILAARRRVTRIAYTIVLFAYAAFLVANQLVYKLFFVPIHWSQSEGAGGLGAAWDSTVAELDAWFVINVVLLVLLVGVVVRFLRRPPSVAAWANIARMRYARVGAGVWLVAAIVVPRVVETHSLHRHPVVSLVTSTFGTGDAYRGRLAKNHDLDALRFDVSVPDDHASLDAARTALGRGRPHVLLIVLESVGAVQLLPNGAPDPSVTPRLAELASRAIILDQLYVSFPSTTRTHLPLLTGGRTITHGSVDDDMLAPYTGPTLIGAMRELGYETAVFSAQRLDYEQLDALYAAQPFHRRTSYESMPPDLRDRDRVHSWGANEQVTWQQARTWLDERARDRPFFLELVTNSTHHPYGAPGDEGDEDGRHDKYLAALRYTDRVVGEILDDLSARGLADDTLIAITGDHGEAFGDRHAKNLGHKNRLYEENVRSFLLLARPGVPGPVRLRRTSRIDDIFPTLLARLGTVGLDVPGQDVLADGYRARIAYFHKSAIPSQWGLRDGRWKFISALDGSRPELYDLELDPTEQRNVAAEHGDQVSAYLELCASWYVRTNDDFVAHTTAATSRGAIRESDLATPGPKSTRFSIRGQTADRFERDAEILAITSWVPYPEPRTLRANWRAPDGSVVGAELFVDAGATTTKVANPTPRPLTAGTWSFVIADERTVLHRSSFVVEP